MNEAQNEIKIKLNELSEILLKNKSELQNILFTMELFDVYLALFYGTALRSDFERENITVSKVVGKFEYKLNQQPRSRATGYARKALLK